MEGIIKGLIDLIFPPLCAVFKRSNTSYRFYYEALLFENFIVQRLPRFFPMSRTGCQTPIFITP